MELATGLRAAVYLRISDDQAGLGLGVTRQLGACRELCGRHGWTVVEVFDDNDHSAYQRKTVRPRYRAMLDAVKQGEVDVIVAWHPDRLIRQSRELVEFIDLVNDTGISVETVQAGHYDLSTPTGRMNARIVGAVAEHESEHKSERIKAKLEQNRAHGKHHGGSRPYGWNEDRRTLNPTEAEVVRYATEQVLAGIPIRALTRDLNGRGHTTATGRQWRHVTTRDMVLRHRNAGILTYRPDPEGPTTEIGTGDWEPIVSLIDFRQVEAILRNPARVTNPGKSGKVHLLSSVAKCGVCGGGIVVGRGRAYKGVSKAIYRCKSMKHVSRDQENLDRFVTKLIIARMREADIGELMAEAKSRTREARALTVQIQALENRMADAASAFAQGAITMSQLTQINAEIRPKVDQLRSESVEPDRNRVLGELVAAEDPWIAWAKMTPDQQKAAVALLLTIEVMPMTRPSPIFNPDDIRVTWRQ